jgi:hypothetical protein
MEITCGLLILYRCSTRERGHADLAESGSGSNEPYYTSRKTQRNVIVLLANALRVALAL